MTTVHSAQPGLTGDPYPFRLAPCPLLSRASTGTCSANTAGIEGTQTKMYSAGTALAFNPTALARPATDYHGS